jgi:hypothetical protein
VQREWFERALRAVETPTMPDAPTMMKARRKRTPVGLSSVLVWSGFLCKHTGNLFDHFSTHQGSHIGNGMAACMILSELAQDQCAPGIQELPAKNVDGAGKGAQRVHGGWDSQHSSCEDQLEEDDTGVNPGHGPEIDSALPSLEDLAIFDVDFADVDALAAALQASRLDCVVMRFFV